MHPSPHARVKHHLVHVPSSGLFHEVREVVVRRRAGEQLEPVMAIFAYKFQTLHQKLSYFEQSVFGCADAEELETARQDH